MNLREASLTKTHEPDKQVFPPLRRGRETDGGREGGTKKMKMKEPGRQNLEMLRFLRSRQGMLSYTLSHCRRETGEPLTALSSQQKWLLISASGVPRESRKGKETWGFTSTETIKAY